MLREQEGEAASDKPYKSFKDYEPGFVHVDIKYLPQMAGESARSYLFVAIDRATRWVYLEIRKDKSARSAHAFLNKLIQAAPFKIQKILTDNDKAFTDRFSAAGERKPTGTHPFDVLCQAHGIEHRLIKPAEGRRPTAWSSDSTGVSPRFCRPPDLTHPRISNKPSSTTGRSTTITSPSVPWAMSRPFRRSSNGNKNALRFL